MKLSVELKSIILFAIIWLGLLSPAQGINLNINDYTIRFSAREMTLKQALDELFQHKEFNIVYGGTEINIHVPVVFTSRNLKLADALQQIEKQAPVEFIVENNHIVVKNRKLEKSYQLTGRVSDAVTRQGLVAANVIIEGTTTGVGTDSYGNFSMRIQPGSYRIKVRYMGYKEQTLEVNLYRDTQVEVKLEVKENEIDAINVTESYNVIENLEAGRTIQTIDSKIIDKVTSNNATDALHGRLNGVWTTKVSGAPGDHMKIRIRGISSIFGCTDPLYVVDGTIIPIVNFENLGIADLNTHDIEKITVLKDASSTAMYGNLGGNGVVLIETKKGEGKNAISFQVKQGFQNFNKRYDLMNGEDFYSTLKLSDKLIKTKFYYRNPSAGVYEKYPEYLDSLGNPLPEDNFQDILFQTGIVNEYQLSGQGSVKSLDYYISGNYFNHNGIVSNSNYRKFSLTSNLSKSFGDKATLRLLYKGSYQKNMNTLDNYLGNSVIMRAINYEPCYFATPDSFLYKSDRLYYNLSSSESSTSIHLLSKHTQSIYDILNENKIKTDFANTLNFQGSYKFTDNLLFRANLSLTFRKQIYTTLVDETLNNINYSRILEVYSKLNDLQTISAELETVELNSYENCIYFSQQYELNYSKQVNGHSFGGLLLFRNYRDNVYWNVDTLASIKTSYLERNELVYLRGSQALYGNIGSVLRSINSTILNVNYNFRNKYYLSLIANLEFLHEGEYISDASLFKSIAFNYDLSKERLLAFPHWVDACNIYLNWGESGNYPLNSLSSDLFDSSTDFVSEDEITSGMEISNLANYYLRPELVRETNMGMKLNLFKNRINLDVDYFQKTNDDLLVKRSIPYYYGGGYIYQNIGQMKNLGYEISLELVPFDAHNTYWSSKFGFSTNKQFITRLDEGVPITFNSTDVLIPDFIAYEKEQLGAIYGYQYVGLWKDYYDKASGKMNPDYVENKGLAYARNDTVISTKISENDKGVIGKSIPDFTFSWLNYFDYKNWSVEMFWYGVAGVDKFNATKASTYISGLNYGVRDIVLDTMKYINDHVFYESSQFIEDASFIRLKTLSFTYYQPKKILGKLEMQYTLTFENLITLTNYTGYDPEAAIYTDNNFTDNAIDKGAYPSPRGMYFTIKMTY